MLFDLYKNLRSHLKITSRDDLKLFSKKMSPCYTLSEVVVVMLIIAVIVAVSIKITKAKLDSVVSYTYYSAYSTLSDVAKSMYIDIKENKVDPGYLTTSVTFKNMFEDLQLNFSEKLATLKLYLNNSFISPAYALSYPDSDFTIHRYYDCDTEDVFYTNWCNGSFNNQYATSSTEYTEDIKNKISEMAVACANDPSIMKNVDVPHVGSLPDKIDTSTTQSGCYVQPTSISWQPNSKGTRAFYKCTYGYDYSGADKYDSSNTLANSTFGTCAYLYHKNTSDCLRVCGCPNAINCPSIDQNCVNKYCGKAVFGHQNFHDFYSGLKTKEFNCPAPSQLYGLKTIHDYAKMVPENNDISGHAFYFNFNPKSVSGNCYYASMSCSNPAHVFTYSTNPQGGRQDITSTNYQNVIDYMGEGNMTPFTIECGPRSCPSHACNVHDSRRYLYPEYCFNDCDNGSGGEITPPVDPEEPDPDPDPEEPEVCDPTTMTCGCGTELDTETCECKPISGFNRECSAGKVWSETECSCIDDNTGEYPSLPKLGVKFCELFETYVNKSGTACQGDQISAGTTDFSGKTPDIVLRNGIRLYNLSKNNQQLIDDLATRPDLTETDDMSDDDRTAYYAQRGYIVYADIDGKNGDSKLWEDVYPFYITLAGDVIPAYDKNTNPNGSGGDSKNHLQVSVLRNNAGRRGVYWVMKSVTFQNAACGSGYINSAAPYCVNYNTQLETYCAPEESSKFSSACKLRPIKPVYLFF